MTENSENLVLEHLRAIRGTLNEHGERLERVELRLAAIEQTLGSLYSLSGSDRGAITHLARRIERRLNLSDT
jgi:hypothetical protein